MQLSDMLRGQKIGTIEKTNKRLNYSFLYLVWRNGKELKACISLSVLSLQEDGELHRLKKKWWHDRSECGQDKAKVNATRK